MPLLIDAEPLLPQLTALETIAEQRHAFLAEADRLSFEWESAAVSLSFLLGVAVERAQGASIVFEDA
ncbi:hypothetical protein SSTU70S_04936 [Stutzerimonas stutzeri]